MPEQRYIGITGCACHSLNAIADEAHAVHRADREYVVALPAGLPLLNANRSRREHWAVVRRTAKDIRTAVCVIARSQRIPLIERARIVYVIHPSPKSRKRDPGNWAESAKAGVDGLVDAGVFADDNSQHVIGPDPRLGEPVVGSQLVFHIYPEGGA